MQFSATNKDFLKKGKNVSWLVCILAIIAQNMSITSITFMPKYLKLNLNY